MDVPCRKAPTPAPPAYVLTPHAQEEMRRRGITPQVVHRVMTVPGQRLPLRSGREVFQSRLLLGRPAMMYLVRVVVDVDRRPVEVVTAYRTSKLSKYWKGAL